MGFRETQDLGRYLGVSILHGRISKDTYGYILERMRRELDGWKCNTLSLVGRVTLALSVLNSIPSFAMQTSVLPVSVTNQIDAIIRNFVWGAPWSSLKFTYLLETVFAGLKTKVDWGSERLGSSIKLTSLGWEILNHREKLWVRVLMSQYLKETGEGPQLRRKSGGSPPWRGIRAVWHEMRGASQQDVQYGKDTLFWSSRWLDSDIILVDHTIVDLSGEDLQLSVQEARSADGTGTRSFCVDHSPTT
ncbi:Putative ribonuclease H protein At1g65750 [Linum perenne]